MQVGSVGKSLDTENRAVQVLKLPLFKERSPQEHVQRLNAAQSSAITTRQRPPCVPLSEVQNVQALQCSSMAKIKKMKPPPPPGV